MTHFSALRPMSQGPDGLTPAAGVSQLSGALRFSPRWAVRSAARPAYSSTTLNSPAAERPAHLKSQYQETRSARRRMVIRDPHTAGRHDQVFLVDHYAIV